MDKKNLDELFREKFTAFREVPNEKVWTGIENSLDKKRKNRIIPFWWKLGGVAAVLAIALVVLYPFGDTANNTPAVTETENTDVQGKNKEKLDSDKKEGAKDALQIPETTEDAMVTSSEDIQDNNREDADKGHNTQKYNPILNKDKAAPNRNTDAIATSRTDTLEKARDNPTGSEIEKRDGIAVNRKDKNIISGEAEKKEAQNEVAVDDSNNPNENKKSIFEALEKQADEEKVALESGSRWSAGPSVAPVYFNAMGKGSPIDPGFSPNSKSGSTNLSYGLSVAYAVTKKLSVRSGIYKAEYGYDTNDVAFSPTLTASTNGRLQNVDYAGSSENLALNSNVSNLDSSENFASEFSALNSIRDGTVAQQFGYLEVPLELDYALIDRRFGVNLVGGISSLFLIDNSVTLSSGELTTEIGEARNLNDLNFSTNIGFGVNYKFTPKVQLNIEPVFKYQLNTFSNVSGDFRPFSVGVYSGLNFKF